MLQILSLADQQFAVQAQTITPIEAGGYRLSGAQIDLLHAFGATHFYRQGFHSWSLSAWLPLDAPLPEPRQKEIYPQIDHPEMLEEHYPFHSSGVGALQGPDGNVLLLGAIQLDGRVRATESGLHGQSAAQEPEPTWFLDYGPEETVFHRYTTQLAGHLGRLGAERPPRVWCSWYSLFQEIEAGQLKRILDELQAEPALPFDVFQIDDGWQQAIGDWRPNDKFPDGMAPLAEAAHAAGMRAGLWLAPFIVAPASRLYQDHADWLLRDEHGQAIKAGHNWGDVYYALDVTHPAVQEWLEALIAEVRSWGYDYLKLDFLFAAALPGVRFLDLPGEAAYRLGMEAVRRAAGDLAYILACGAPVIASLGLADGLRIGPDVAPYWENYERSIVLQDPTGPGTLNALRTSLHRLWLRPLIQVDPDVAFFRTRYNLLTQEEKGLLQALALITGFRATSDLPQWLDPEERQALQRFLKAAPEVKRLDRYHFQVDGNEVDYSFLG